MASQLDQIKEKYKSIKSLEEKKLFIVNLDKKIKEQNIKNKTYSAFISECVKEYNNAIKDGIIAPQKQSFKMTQPQKTARAAQFSSFGDKLKKLTGNRIIRAIAIIALAIVAVILIIRIVGFIIQVIIGVLTVVLAVGLLIFFNFIDDIADGGGGSVPIHIPIEPIKKRPRAKSVTIDNKRFEVDENDYGDLLLHEYFQKPKYIAKEILVGPNYGNCWAVYDEDGIKVGEMDFTFWICKGIIQSMEE